MDIMSRITGLEKTKQRHSRINVYLDDCFAFSLEKSIVQEAGLYTGQELNEAEANMLIKADANRRCLDTALRYLSYRDRSEKEIKEHLVKHGFNIPVIEQTMLRLHETGLIDDNEFARRWTENREQCSPRGRRALIFEMQQKGLSQEIIEQALAGVDESASAYRAAVKKARNLSCEDQNTFYRRMSGFLVRRGFNYDTIKKTIETLWKERN